MAQKIKKTLIILTVLLGLAVPFFAGVSFADSTPVPCHPEANNSDAKPLDNTINVNGITQLQDCEACQPPNLPTDPDPAKAQEQFNACAVCHPGAASPASTPLGGPNSDAFKSCNDCNTASPALQDCLSHNKIVVDLNIFVDTLSGLAGIVIIGSIILGGIQYAIAGDSAESTTKAKNRIINAVMALAVFLFIFAFLQWLIPGGIFK